MAKDSSSKVSVDFESRTYAKVTWRLLPFLCLCYFCAYLDRVNIGFAKLQMLDELKWSETVYGLGAGIFFLGYVLVEVPSNILLERIGARRWIARIMISWAIISGGHRICLHADAVLHNAIFAWGNGSRLSARRCSIPRLLVPSQSSRNCDSPFLLRDSVLWCDWWTAFRMDFACYVR